MRKKTSISERLARRPGPRKAAASKAIRKQDQSLNPRIADLNASNPKSGKNRRGAPLGNQNRRTSGRYSGAYRALQADIRILGRLAGVLEGLLDTVTLLGTRTS